MKSTAVPLTCTLALIAMLAAGLSQWWAVNQLVLAVGGTMPRQMHAVTPGIPASPRPAPAPAAEPDAKSLAAIQNSPAFEKLCETFIAEIKAGKQKLQVVEQQNQDLRDQVAATNRDIMEIQFRLDSHSESFRPLKVAPEQAQAPDDGPGVLPPRALPAEEDVLGQ